MKKIGVQTMSINSRQSIIGLAVIVLSFICQLDDSAADEVDELIRTLRDRKVDVSVRAEAARRLGEIGDLRAIEPLVDALGDRYLRKSASDALIEIGAPAVEPLIDAALKHATGQVRVGAWLVLGMIGDDRAVDAAIVALADDDWNVRMAGSSMLGEMRDPKAVDPLLRMLEDENNNVRGVAITALGKISDPRAVEPLIQFFVDIRLWDEAIEALIEIGAPAVDALIDALKDEREPVRRRSLDTLNQMQACEVAIEGIIEVADDESAAVRWIAAGALSKVFDPRAVDVLIRLLADEDHMVREGAAQGLGRIGDPRAVEALIDALDDEATGGRAARALGEIGDPRAVEPLINALDRPFHIRDGVIIALAKFEAPRVIEPLVAALPHGSAFKALQRIGTSAFDALIRALEAEQAPIRASSALLLGPIGDLRAVEPLIAALSDVEFSVRRNAAVALGVIGDERAIEPLIDALNDEHPKAREGAAIGLGLIDDPRAVKPLLTALDDPDDRVQREVIRALSTIGGDLAVEQLIAILENNEPAFLLNRSIVINALAQIGDPRAVQPLINVLNSDEHRDIRAKAATALGKIGDPRAVDPLINIMLRDPPDVGVNDSAATALGKIGDLRAVEPLIVVLRTRKRGVPTLSAAWALIELGDPRVVEPLIDLLQHPSPEVQMASAQALGELGDPRAAEPLVQLFRERDQAAAQLNFEFLINALAQIGPPIVEPLIEALQDRDVATRAGAARILGRIGDSRAVPELTRLAREDNSFYVRHTAEEALAKIAQPLAVESHGKKAVTFGAIKHNALYQNYPNPFNPETWIPFALAEDAAVSIQIFNIRGEQVRELNLGVVPAGAYTSRARAAYWDGKNTHGESVASGIYFYYLKTPGFQAARKMLLAK